MTTYLDPATPLPPPTVRDLIPDYAWAWDRINMTWEEFDAMAVDEHHMGHPDRDSAAPYRSNTASYGETVGAWYVNRLKRVGLGEDGNGVQYECLMIYIDGKPVIEQFDDSWHDLSKKSPE
jgi:hypothetical protein